MVLGGVILFFILGFSHIFDQGLRQLQQRQNYSWLTSNMDSWTTEILEAELQRNQGEASAIREKLLEYSPTQKYRLHWRFQEQTTPKIIFFTLKDAQDENVTLHEWKTAVRL